MPFAAAKTRDPNRLSGISGGLATRSYAMKAAKRARPTAQRPIVTGPVASPAPISPQVKTPSPATVKAAPTQSSLPLAC